MKKIAKITLILSVYLVWVFGNSVIALSCRANHEEHIHCCSKHCDCHHEGWELAHFESPHGCHHDHSNKIVLYDTTKEREFGVKPVMCYGSLHLPTPNPSLLAPDSTLLTPDFIERSVALPPLPTLSRHGMRAPPVVA